MNSLGRSVADASLSRMFFFSNLTDVASIRVYSREPFARAIDRNVT
jgi:hypothetical protein